MQKILTLLFCIITFVVTAQTSYVDSLINQLPKVHNDTIKARLYKSIAEEAATYDLTLAAKYAAEGMRHVQKMKWKKGIAVFNHLTGTIYSEEGNYEKAIEYFETAYRAHLENGDDYNAATTLNGIGSAYSRQSNADKATENYFAALALAEEISNADLQALCFNNIAIVYFDQNNLEKAMEYEEKALKLYRANQNKTGIANTCVTIANTYLVKRDTVNADKYYNEALTLYTSENDEFGTATTLTNVSMLYGQTQKNLDYKLRAQEIWDRISPSHPTSITNLGNLGLMYLDIVRSRDANTFSIQGSRQELLKIAENYLNRGAALSKESNATANHTFLLGLLSELETEKGNFKKALEYSQQFHHLNDSLYSQESKNKIAAIEGQREVALRDKEIELNKVALSAQRKQNVALTLGLGLVLIIGILLYRQNQIRKKTNASLLQLNSQLDEANKVKAKFFAILSHDLRSPLARLINFLHLQKEAPDLLTGEQAAAHQQKIVTSAETLLENMETVLLWGKGQMVNFKPVKKKVVIASLFKQLDIAFKSYEQIRLTFSDSENLEIITDENYLFTIMQNLTANALKVLEGKTNGSIHWKAEKQNDGKVTLSITDNGPGLREEQKENLLSGQEITGNKTGFGFHIVRSLAEAIECTIDVQSTMGRGTTFLLHC